MSDLRLHPRIVDLICSRICHDVINPISAINNGIELVSEMGEGVDGEAFSLIADSAAIVAARLNVMRYCFGAAGPSFDEVRTAALAYFEGGKVAINWPRQGLLDPSREMKPALPKMVLNTVLLLAEAVGIAGTVTLEQGLGTQIIVTAEATRSTIRMDVLAGMGAAPESLEAKTIQAYYTGIIAERFDYSLQKQVGDKTVTITIS
jgi:histidine phosphotransferase ChpT